MGEEQIPRTIAVLVMGHMGQALAGRLLDQGLNVVIWNRSPRDLSDLEARGAAPLAEVIDRWDHAAVAITFLANDEGLAEVCLSPGGVLQSGIDGRVLIDMSTVSPGLSSEIATRAETVGIDYLRSPVSGNPATLSSGEATLLVSGPRDAYERLEWLFSLIGPSVLYVGDAEHSRTLKLAINAGLAITTQLMTELIVLGESSGVDRSSMLRALGESVIGSRFVRYKTPGLVARDYSATFTTNLLVKDLQMALDVAHGAALSLPVIELVDSLARTASGLGYGETDLTSLLPSLQVALGQSPDIAPSPS